MSRPVCIRATIIADKTHNQHLDQQQTKVRTATEKVLSSDASPTTISDRNTNSESTVEQQHLKQRTKRKVRFELTKSFPRGEVAPHDDFRRTNNQEQIDSCSTVHIREQPEKLTSTRSQCDGNTQKIVIRTSQETKKSKNDYRSI
jgi:hypothetical protein